jgi:hypothetical protein
VPAAVVGDDLDVRRCLACVGVRSGSMCCLVGGGGGRRSCAAATCSQRVITPRRRLPWGGGTAVLKGMNGEVKDI